MRHERKEEETQDENKMASTGAPQSTSSNVKLRACPLHACAPRKSEAPADAASMMTSVSLSESMSLKADLSTNGR